jgi:dihydroxyacetone kinase
LLKVADLELGGLSLLELLDAPAEASGWSAAINSGTWQKRGQAAEQEKQVDAEEIRPSTLRGKLEGIEISREILTAHQ